MTTELQLSHDEVATLVVLLDASISDLSPEIAGTDNPGYRTMLRGRRESLRSIRGKLNGAGRS